MFGTPKPAKADVPASFGCEPKPAKEDVLEGAAGPDDGEGVAVDPNALCPNALVVPNAPELLLPKGDAFCGVIPSPSIPPVLAGFPNVEVPKANPVWVAILAPVKAPKPNEDGADEDPKADGAEPGFWGWPNEEEPKEEDVEEVEVVPKPELVG